MTTCRHVRAVVPHIQNNRKQHHNRHLHLDHLNDQYETMITNIQLQVQSKATKEYEQKVVGILNDLSVLTAKNTATVGIVAAEASRKVLFCLSSWSFLVLSSLASSSWRGLPSIPHPNIFIHVVETVLFLDDRLFQDHNLLMLHMFLQITCTGACCSSLRPSRMRHGRGGSSWCRWVVMCALSSATVTPGCPLLLLLLEV